VNPVRQPVFVLGMPRTGTTFLHRLLSLDPAARAPLTYELQDPVPRYRDDPILDKQKRIKYCQKEIDMLNYYMPEMSQVHEMGADIPEECMVAMVCYFPSFCIFQVDLLKKPIELHILYTTNIDSREIVPYCLQHFISSL